MSLHFGQLSFAYTMVRHLQRDDSDAYLRLLLSFFQFFDFIPTSLSLLRMHTLERHRQCV